MSGLIGGSSNIDIAAIADLVSNLIGSNGEIDIAQIVQLVGGLIGGSGALGDIDIGAIADLIGGLIGGNTGNDFDIGAITDLISGFVGENAAGDFDLDGFTDLLSGLIANGSNGIDLGGLLGHLNLDSDLDLGTLIEGISSASNGFDPGSIAGGIGQLIDNSSSIELPDPGDLVQDVGATDSNIDLSALLPDIQDTIQNISSGGGSSSFDFGSLFNHFSKNIDIDPNNPWG